LTGPPSPPSIYRLIKKQILPHRRKSRPSSFAYYAAPSKNEKRGEKTKGGQEAARNAKKCENELNNYDAKNVKTNCQDAGSAICRHRDFMNALIFVSLEDWDEVWRRNQFVCAGLSRRFPDTRILFVGLPRNVSHRLRRGDFSILRPAAAEALPEYPNISILHPLKLFPNTLALGRRLNETIARRQIKKAAARLKMDKPLLWLNPHSAVHMAGRMNESAVVYDITDDWISPIQSEPMRRLITAQDAALCRRADAVIVCSDKLREMKQGLTRRLALIPNGVETEHYSAVLKPGQVPDAATAWNSPVFGYTGTIHPERVDVDLVLTLSRSFPGGTVALVGPDLLSSADRARLDTAGNVVRTGPVPYHNLPDYMRAFDVCITPHCMSTFTESLNPIKLWEYLAGGKPVVSTNVAGFRDYPALVHLSNTPNEFVAACRAALEEPASGGQARQSEAQKHTWEARVSDVITVLEGLEK
jgi:teichuronic acid biosynthesis glycosyltransferase TuaH